jgi:hypothetical protein
MRVYVYVSRTQTRKSRGVEGGHILEEVDDARMAVAGGLPSGD